MIGINTAKGGIKEPLTVQTGSAMGFSNGCYGVFELSHNRETRMERIYLQNSLGLSRVDEWTEKKPPWAGLQTDLS